jgi:chaperonin GroEL
MSDSCRIDVEFLLRDLRTVFGEVRTFAVHKPGGKPLITTDTLVAFDNMTYRSPMHELVMLELKRTELSAPGAAYLAGQALIVTLSEALATLDGGSPWVSIVDDAESNLARILQHIEQINHYPLWSEIERVAAQGLDASEIELLTTILKVAGPSGRVYLEPSYGPSSVVERVIGNSFKLEPCVSIMQGGQWRRDYVKCAIIDGIIESVSEIDKLLTACHESRQPTVIFARGFDNDVISTLVVNRARGALDVMAVTAPYDLELINVLNDVAVVCGGDPVSALKGDLISSAKFEELPTVQSVHCTNGFVTIRNDITRRNVELHSARLIQKMYESNIEDIGYLIDSRIRSLTSDYVRALVSGSTHVTRQASMEKIDRALRTVKSARAAGVMTWGDIILPASLLAIREPENLVSSMALVAGLQSSFRLTCQLLSILGSRQTSP